MMPSSDANVSSHLTGIGADLSLTFDQPPESGSGADFIITADPDDDDYVDVATPDPNGSSTAVSPVSRPIHVHKLILHARWPHFARLWSAQMAEFHSKKMHIPEPYSAVRAFLFYLQLTGRSFGGSNRKRSLGSAGVLTAGEDDGEDEVEDDGMDVN
ncbi:unnamed protein product [Alternaria alternata]